MFCKLTREASFDSCQRLSEIGISAPLIKMVLGGCECLWSSDIWRSAFIPCWRFRKSQISSVSKNVASLSFCVKYREAGLSTWSSDIDFLNCSSGFIKFGKQHLKSLNKSVVVRPKSYNLGLLFSKIIFFLSTFLNYDQ
jgi:hypothetical protein